MSATVSGLNAGTTYYFAVRSRNADGTVVSVFSNEVATTIAPSADTTPPTVSISASPTGPTFTTAATVMITANATDNVGVSQVQFYDGSTLVGTDTSAPFSYAWSVTSAANGTHNWTAKAYDAANNVRTASALALTAAINTADTTAPTVTLSAAPAGPSYSSAQTVTVAATAADNVGVTRVAFYDGATLIATDTSAPYSVTWSVTSAVNGSHTWTAKAYDAANNVGTSSALSLTAAIATIDTTAPSTPANLTATPTGTSAVNLTWTASTDNVAVTGYLVERCQGAGCASFAQVATTTAASFADSGLTAGTLYQYRVRATDAATNKSGYSNTSTAAPSVSSCAGTSVWAASATPTTLADADTVSVELGMKFKSDVDGYICGVRFYKSTANTGSHVGSLWSSTGTRLAQVAFAQESASGWQQANFATPVAVKAGTVYVVSYLAPKGRYSSDSGYFTSKGADSAPLHALQSGVSGSNGVYLYGAGGFPTNSWQATNYWVDVVFMNKTAMAAAASEAGLTEEAAAALEAGLLEEAAAVKTLAADAPAASDATLTKDATVDATQAASTDDAAAPKTAGSSASIGVYRPQTTRFYLDTDADFELSDVDRTTDAFGTAGDLPLVGDWTGDGIAKVGVYRPSTRRFILDLDGDNRLTKADLPVTSFGVRGDLPVSGDWNGDGITDVGVYRPSNGRFYLDLDNSLGWTTGDVETEIVGQTGDLPVAGDWTGDGVAKFGVYRPGTGRFLLDMDNSGSDTDGDLETDALGTAEDLPIVGDWNSDGIDEVGLYNPSTREFYLDTDGSGSLTSDDIQTAPFGNPGDQPVSGHWK